MRVLAITNLYPNPFQPQRATFNRQQLRALAEDHCPVRVIAPIAWTDELRARRSGKPPLPVSRQVQLDGLTVDHPRVLYTPGAMRGWYGKFFLWSVRSTFKKAVADFRPTIVYSPWVYPDGWAAVQLARQAGLPVIIKALGSDVLLLSQHPARKAGTIAALREADGITAVSRDLADKMIALGADSACVRVVYNGLDSKLFCPGPQSVARQAVEMVGSSPQLLFVGNLVPVKGIDVLLKACTQLLSKGQSFNLHMIGEGPLREPLKNLSKTLGIDGFLRWHGTIPHSELPNWYRAADLVVLPSRSEGVPNVLLEATGCGTPWVATRVGGIPEISHLGNNQIVAAESAEELARALQHMLITSHPASGGLPATIEQVATEMAEYFADVESMRHQGATPASPCSQ